MTLSQPHGLDANILQQQTVNAVLETTPTPPVFTTQALQSAPLFSNSDLLETTDEFIWK